MTHSDYYMFGHFGFQNILPRFVPKKISQAKHRKRNRK